MHAHIESAYIVAATISFNVEIGKRSGSVQVCLAEVEKSNSFEKNCKGSVGDANNE
jgi:hypothetical protein